MAGRGLKLLFDENFSRPQVDFVAKQSRLAEIQHILTLGWSGQEDSAWIPLAVRAGFCIVTGDRNEATRGYTVADLRALRAKVILVGAFFDHLDRRERAKWLVARMDRLVNLARSLSPGSVVLLDRYAKPKPL